MNGGRFESWLRCPCCVRRAEHVIKTMRRRVMSALATAGLAALAALCLSASPVQAAPTAGPATSTAGHWWSEAGKIALIAIAVAVVGAFVALQVIARSRHRRRPTFADWRTWPPGYDPETGTCRVLDRGRDWS
jgi:uncharacterized membrane protein YbhN (UPF0104 family)